MASPTSWEFYKEIETKTLWVNICTQNLEGVAISINKWWKTRYPEYKIRYRKMSTRKSNNFLRNMNPFKKAA